MGTLADRLRIDAEEETRRVAEALRELVLGTFRRRGAIVALSGGIDSSVTAALAVRALGPSRVLGLLLPEQDASGDSTALGELVARHLGVPFVVEDITSALSALGCYRRRDDAIRSAIPAYGPGWKSKLVLPSLLEGETLRVFSVVAEAPDGRRVRARLGAEAYLELVAATSFKQRCRKMLEYFHADRLGYAVLGTPNRLEYDQGFFVKGGDGAADVKPIAHLYKSQVYALAEHLGVPAEIRARPPTTDTYSLPQSQEEFYFSLPYDKMDLCLLARDLAIPARDVAEELALSPAQVERVFRDIDAKRAHARYLHMDPVLIGEGAPVLA